MTLRVQPVVDPPAGSDWTYSVPGIYLERITAIQGTLVTLGGAATIAHDASGNGRDGAYNFPPDAPIFVASLLPAGGDGACFMRQPVAHSARTCINMPIPTMDFGAPWSMDCWQQATMPIPPFIDIADIYHGDPIGGAPDIRIQVDTGGHITVNQNAGNSWDTAVGYFADLLPHHLAVTYDGAVVVIYYDGVALPLVGVGVPFLNTAFDFGTVGGVVGIPDNFGTLDEFALYESVLTPADVAAHYVAASVSFPAYEAAVLANNPYAYYHLFDSGLGGRTPLLRVGDGTNIVADIGDGFPAQPTGSSFDYSWVVGASSDSQTLGGAVTTVGIPRLVLPGGYLVGTFTPDLQPTDQWRNVTVWWDDDVMSGHPDWDPYRFPPGAFLVYQPGTG